MKTLFTKLVLSASLVLAMTFIISCCMTPSGYTLCPFNPPPSEMVLSSSSYSVEPSSSPSVEPSSSSEATRGEFIDSRDSKKYRYVKIGTKIWMAENLNYNVPAPGSVCYDYWEGNCTKYGRLYDWATAMKACPSDWHLPSDADWDALMTAVGGSETAGTKLKANSPLWDGTDDFGFAALPGSDSYRGGNGYTGGAFGQYGELGKYGGWWSTKSTEHIAYMRQMGTSYDNVMETGIDKLQGYSVRCLMN